MNVLEPGAMVIARTEAVKMLAAETVAMGFVLGCDLGVSADHHAAGSTANPHEFWDSSSFQTTANLIASLPESIDKVARWLWTAIDQIRFVCKHLEPD